jgi:hypothetical protein
MKWHTDTPDWSDRRLDDLVSGALRSTVVTPQQKRDAWRKLQERAAAQPMLPPLPASPVVVEPAPVERRFAVNGRRLLALTMRALDWTCALLFDDTRYDRALRHRYTRLGVTLLDTTPRHMLGGVAT